MGYDFGFQDLNGLFDFLFETHVKGSIALFKNDELQFIVFKALGVLQVIQ